ncbi:MAG: PAS domain S-box protein [Legionellales bacterium]
MDHQLSNFIKPSKDETKFKFILEATPDCLVIINEKGVIVLVNTMASKIFGYNQEEIIGKTIEFLIPKRFHHRHTNHRSHYFDQPRVRPMGMGSDLYGLHKDGHEFPVEISLSPMETDEGRLALAAVRDITERKKIEDAKAMLSAIVAYSNDAVIGKNLEGNIMSWNKGAENLYGFTAEEAIGQSISIVFPPNRKEELETILKSIKQGIPIQHFSTERMHKNKKIIPCSVTISPIKDSNENIIGASSTARDTTEQRHLEEQLRNKNIELEAQNKLVQEANRLKSEFLANMSHELRTPLNAIIGFSELMYAGKVGPLAPNHKEYLYDILTSSQHLLQLINDVLDLAKIESGKMYFNPEPIQLDKTIGEVCDILRALVAKKQINLSVTIDNTIGEVSLDPSKFKQILYNYISNAIKFTHEGGHVTVTVHNEGLDKMRLEVQDNGIGIQEEDINRLFVEFQQLDTSTAKKYPGTGLGLALTRRIVEAQGGQVGVQSKINEGSTFYAILSKVF